MPTGPNVPIVFFVEEESSTWKVTQETTKRKCGCPEGQPPSSNCRLY